MSIRNLVQDTSLLLAVGRPTGALLAILSAVGATSRRRFPLGTRSKFQPVKDMGDREAFETFLADEMPRLCRVANFFVQFRGQQHRLEHILYKWLRCALAHEGELPADVRIVADPGQGQMVLKVDPSTGIELSIGWFYRLQDVVMACPENSTEFGASNLAFPFTVKMPGICVTISQRNFA